MSRVTLGTDSFQPKTEHRPLCSLWYLLVLALLAAFVAGCGNDNSSTDDQATPGDNTLPSALRNAPEMPCSLTIDFSGLADYRQLAPSLFTPPGPTDEQLQNFVNLPTYNLLRESSDRMLLNRKTLSADLKALATLPSSIGKNGRLESRYTSIQDNLLYLHHYDDELWPLLDRYVASGNPHGPCEILTLLDGFLPAAPEPAGLDLVFLVMAPEVRYQDGKVLVDASLALAAGHEQLNHLIAATVYRALAKPAGPLPTEREGADALASTFARLGYLGAATWLEGYMDIVMDSRHPLLGRSQLAREHALTKGRRALIDCNHFLGQITVASEVTASQGKYVDDLLRGSGSWESMSFSMAALIVDRLGIDRLKACATTPVRFLIAFQEAAVFNEPAIVPTLHSLPAFAPEAFTRLLRIMETQGYAVD